jgi:hypothetical protein
MEGYKEANKIDRLIGNLIVEHHIVIGNLRDWRAFTRTVRTTLDIIDTCIIGKVEAENEKALQKKRDK